MPSVLQTVTIDVFKCAPDIPQCNCNCNVRRFELIITCLDMCKIKGL